MEQFTQLLNTQDAWELGYFAEQAARPAEHAGGNLPPAVTGLQVFGVGTFGAKTTQRVAREIVEQDGELPLAAYIEYPEPKMNDIPVTVAAGKVEELPAAPFYPVGLQGDRRDVAKQYPLLRKRYARDNLLRGIAVWDDRKLGVSGKGGGAIPSVTRMDIDLRISPLMTFLQDTLYKMLGESASGTPGTDLEHVIGEAALQEDHAHEHWIIPVIGGGAGATGNALLQILPYLVRYILRGKGIGAAQYQLIAFVHGPNAFKGLTPYVFTNYRALLHSLDYMTRNGLHTDFINGLKLDMDVPPYDQVFLLDDNTLPIDENGRVTEAGLDEFAERSARAIAVLLGSNALETIAARNVNPDTEGQDDGKLRWLSTLSIGTAAVDKRTLMEQVTYEKQAQLLDDLAGRLAV